ncbi:MAG: FxDxF family PEP-CTERM protein [Gallionellaceae bacterium]|nr:FxDxF family PEP-CTERM protein [Gallionellaceae bacterium]
MKNTYLRVISATVAMLLGLAAGAAHALTAPLTFTDNVTSHDAVFGNPAVRGSFSDTYTFTIPTGAGTEGGAVAISGWGFTGPTHWITSFTLTDVTTGIVVGSGSPGTTSNYTFSGLNPADSFALNVMGTAMKVRGSGSYTGSIQITPTSPIPEPDTYAMVLAGLGLLGFTARRRKTNV